MPDKSHYKAIFNFQWVLIAFLFTIKLSKSMTENNGKKYDETATKIFNDTL